MYCPRLFVPLQPRAVNAALTTKEPKPMNMTKRPQRMAALMLLVCALLFGTSLNANAQIRTARDFILALKSDANITMTTGDGLVNLTEAINDLIDDGYITPYNLDPNWERVQTKPGIYYSAEYDGNQLIVVGMNNINIEGTGANGAFLQVEPRYAEVIKFVNCKNIGISNFTMGHSETGDCVGDVLEFQSCENIAVNNCRLFGCGVNGLTVRDSKSISANGTHFYGCYYYGLQLFGSQDAIFVNCQIYSNGMGIYLDDVCGNVSFDKCEMMNNRREVFVCQSPISVSNSKIISHGGANVYNVTLEGCDVTMDYADCEELPDLEEDSQYEIYQGQ